MPSPRTLLRMAALNALASAAAVAESFPQFLPLLGTQVFLGQDWPSQSPAPGAGPLPNQVLIYIWDEKSRSVASKTTAPQFETTAMLVIEARVETRVLSATALLPAMPTDVAIAAAIDGRLDTLTYAIKDAVCRGVQVAAMAANGGSPWIEGIESVEVADKVAGDGQRVAGNGVVTFDLVYGEQFAQLASMLPLTDLAILIGAEAGALAQSGNTGNGTISSVTAGIGATAGAYAVTFTSAADFVVAAPGALPLAPA